MKRDIFAEINEGFDALAEQRQGTFTLSTQGRTGKAEAPVCARAGKDEEWGQYFHTPLIRLVDRFPETVDHLAALG